MSFGEGLTVPHFSFMYILNWYPGSFGDRIMIELFDVPYRILDEAGAYRMTYDSFLKYPNTYKLPLTEMVEKFNAISLPFIEKNKVTGAHRLSKFDYKLLNPELKTISIDPTDCYEQIADAFLKKVYGVHGIQSSADAMIEYLLENNLHSQAKQYQEKLIKQWQKDNIIETDYIFYLKEYLKNKNYIEWFKINVMS